MLRSTQICKKFTIFVNLRTLAQERKNKTRLMISFFHLLFELFVIFSFVFEKCQNYFSWGHRFNTFWSVRYLNFWGERCEIRILTRSIQETYTLNKIKNQVLLSNRVGNQICQISWSNKTAQRLQRLRNLFHTLPTFEKRLQEMEQYIFK